MAQREAAVSETSSHQRASLLASRQPPHLEGLELVRTLILNLSFLGGPRRGFKNFSKNMSVLNTFVFYDLFLVVSCGDPGELSNGVIYGNTFTYQSRVVLECDPQYRLVGDLTRTCQADGSWSGTQPTCQRK